MTNVTEIFKTILNEESARLRSNYPGNDVIFPLIEIIRTLDYHTLILKAKSKLSQNVQAVLLEKYRYGWSLAFRLYYQDLQLEDGVPLFTFNQSEREFIDQLVQHAGAIQIGSQLLDYCRADLMTLSSENKDIFQFEYRSNGFGVEYFERLSTDYYFLLIDKILEEKKKGYIDKLPKMRTKLKDIVNVVHEKFITYVATDEFDIFYTRLGYLSLMTSQIVDDFDESDTFGGIPYKKYMDHVEYLFRAAVMHRDCCMALLYKSSHKIDLRDILTYAFRTKAFSEALAKYLGEDSEQLQEVISCLSTNKQNFEYHLSYPGVSASPYFQIGSDTLMRSIYGCLDKPIQFLNRELKRKYPTDFFNAVNNRELRFRSELYDLFKQEQIIKINENVIIKTQVGNTDIDAIMFDIRRNTLGLFQLKWQDSFSSSMKERFSRITNLIPKSVEWIDKVKTWLEVNHPKTILQTLKIKDASDISEVHLFVISRHHVHFTNQPLDKRAIWASWFQVIESSAKVKDFTNANPIAELAVKLRFFTPTERSKREEQPSPLEFELDFSKYKIITQFKK